MYVYMYITFNRHCHKQLHFSLNGDKEKTQDKRKDFKGTRLAKEVYCLV